MTVESGLAEPPADLDGFPEADHVPELHRLSDYPGAWWFASVDAVDDDDGGRFDRVRPRGTCHLGESLDGALVEKLLREPAKVVAAERLAELFHATVTVRKTPRTADLTAPAATGFGLNAEIHSSLDYRVPRLWAGALERSGFRGLRHKLRGDVAGIAAGRALFGPAGLASRAPAGMSTKIGGLDRAEAERLLDARGVTVLPIPTVVPISPPPA
jgi:hypothetical protein